MQSDITKIQNKILTCSTLITSNKKLKSMGLKNKKKSKFNTISEKQQLNNFL